jgi:hypothetical protein
VILAEEESFILFKVTVEAANPFASPLVVATKFAVPITVELLALPPLHPVASTSAVVMARPNQTSPLHFLAAMRSVNKLISARNVSVTANPVERGHLKCAGAERLLVDTAVRVTVPVGATPKLPDDGFTDVCVSTKTVTENAVFAATVVGADENDECV